jgi:hypothetical protein
MELLALELKVAKYLIICTVDCPGLAVAHIDSFSKELLPVW